MCSCRSISDQNSFTWSNLDFIDVCYNSTAFYFRSVTWSSCYILRIVTIKQGFVSLVVLQYYVLFKTNGKQVKTRQTASTCGIWNNLKTSIHLKLTDNLLGELLFYVPIWTSTNNRLYGTANQGMSFGTWLCLNLCAAYILG